MNQEPLTLGVTAEAKAEFERFLSRITEYHPTLCFLKTREIHETESYWTYGAYTPENIDTIKSMALSGGYIYLHAVGNIPVVIPQAQFLEDLKGNTVGVGGGGKLRMLVLSKNP